MNEIKAAMKFMKFAILISVYNLVVLTSSLIHASTRTYPVVTLIDPLITVINLSWDWAIWLVGPLGD